MPMNRDNDNHFIINERQRDRETERERERQRKKERERKCRLSTCSLSFAPPFFLNGFQICIMV